MVSHIDAAGLTDVGRKREVNQDQFLIADLSKSLQVDQTSIDIADASTMFGGSQGKLLLVADGVGGHAGGETASAVAISSIATYVLNSLQWYFRLDHDNEEDFTDDLKSAVEFSNEEIKRAGRQSSGNYRMGTTATLAYVIWPRLYVMHVGDSRCYLIRGDSIECMTEDHTMAAVLAGADGVSPEECKNFSNVLWNVLGGGEENKDLKVEAHKSKLEVGDTLLLCSDGLYKYLSDEELLATLQRCDSSEAACRQLVDQANNAGGSDNITVVVSRFNAPPDKDSSAVVDTKVPLDSIVGQDKPRKNLNDTDEFIPKS